ncbi:MAG: gamma carbonic anhydrase family protein [Sandaracinaceae bacterium]|nr:gamma carbonic anhydrase family protein [Sandaracinaceae bacterium]
MNLHPFGGALPQLDPQAWAAPTATLVGDVTVGARSTIWFGAVVRGDVMPIRIGARTSIQDNCVLHATGGWSETLVGDDCTVGHAAILHGCTVHDRVLIGMGSIVLDGAEIASDTILGAGSLVAPRARIPSGVLALGRPAKPVRELNDDERRGILAAAEAYLELLTVYK